MTYSRCKLKALHISGHGYTLMELMAVLAVIFILLLMATPSYLGRHIQYQISEALQLAEIAKRPIAAIWATHQSLPLDNAGAGLPDPGKIVSNVVKSISVEEGAIQITFGNHAYQLLQDKMLTLRPAVVEDAPVVPVVWVCGLSSAPGSMSVKGANKTSIPAKYLPPGCH